MKERPPGGTVTANSGACGRQWWQKRASGGVGWRRGRRGGHLEKKRHTSFVSLFPLSRSFRKSFSREIIELTIGIMKCIFQLFKPIFDEIAGHGLFVGIKKHSFECGDGAFEVLEVIIEMP
ncbi:hypothetical protein GOBAR_DD28996 [Gossypium barbadense]|nr:hypothetical protein GOBAR_DD28996 [Gossypium barbadense]